MLPARRFSTACSPLIQPLQHGVNAYADAIIKVVVLKVLLRVQKQSACFCSAIFARSILAKQQHGQFVVCKGGNMHILLLLVFYRFPHEDTLPKRANCFLVAGQTAQTGT